MSISFINLFIIYSAGWRVASLIANERGPFAIFNRIREWAKAMECRYKICEVFGLFEMLECEWCNSVYIGTALTVAWYFLGDAVVYVCIVLSISTWVIVIKLVTDWLKIQIEKSKQVQTKEA